jgi:hypothetical protein
MTDIQSIEFEGDFEFNNTARNICTAFERALNIEHRLPNFVVKLVGMSGRKYRYWINNFISLQEAPQYLEVGSWRGSTACSAMVGNKLSLTCIDNWSLFDGPKEDFLRNIEACKNSETNFNFIESDFRKVNYESIGKFNIYLFDGPHSEEDQYDGIKLALPALDDTFTLIVDDWNWEEVRDGTILAIKELQLKVHCSITIKTTENPQPSDGSDWHNGYFIALCSKPTELLK